MITKNIVKLINSKFNSIIFALALIGFLFFVLAIAILFYPQLLQIVFIASFLLISFSLFLMAVKIYNIKEHFGKITDILPQKKK